MENEEALPHLEKAVKGNPAHTPAGNLLGVTYGNLDRREEAIEAFLQALEQEPDSAECLYNLGLQYEALRRNTDALEVYRRAYELKPDLAYAAQRAGEMMTKLGYGQAAMKYLATAVKRHPNDAHVVNALGNALDAMHDATLYQRMTTLYKRASDLDENCIPCVANLARVLRMRLKHEESRKVLEMALQRHPEAAGLHSQLGDLYKDGDKLRPAIDAYQRSLQLEPELHVFCNYMFTLQSACEWGHPDFNYPRFWSTIEQLQLTHALSASYTCVQPIQAMLFPFTPRQLQQIARSYARTYLARAQDRNMPPFKHTTYRAGERLRIGYMSSDFRQHPLSYLMRSVFAMHDRETTEVFLFSTHRDDGSLERRDIEAAAEHFIDIVTVETGEAARLIASYKLHVLVDLNGHTQGNRNEIFALRPAPITISYMGFCGSTGASYEDYFATDRVTVPPEHATYFDEKLVVMRDSYFVTDHKQRWPQMLTGDWAAPARAELGLPDDKFVFCAFASLPKLDETTVQTWLQVLQRTPNSVLWLLRWPDACVPIVQRAAEAAGIDPQRLVFTGIASFEGHMRRIQRCDLHLDTLHVATHTVACDVLWAGLPMVVRPDATIASRVSSSIALALGVPEMVQETLADFVDKAVQLATEPQALDALRAAIRSARTEAPLFDTALWVRRWEESLRLTVDAPRGHHIIAAR
eukprot:TRINITY_DN5544_c0_g1_i2.p1 TRINITY_DN5544_c0_g1~~TRINITY_DN5544_c0_g1_i2.p1  ORF type:complete len:817 (+),score=174.51 TRINITY_DN5544_c0_g1_i2:369-2453(+)